MKRTTHWIIALTVAGLTALTACSKKAGQVEAPEFSGVKVDLPKLDTEFVGAAESLQNNVAAVKRYFRYGQYPQALAELGKLASQPSLTEPQKKLVNDLTEQIKQVMTKAPSMPGPGR